MSFEVIFITEKTRLAYFEQIEAMSIYTKKKTIYNPETQNRNKMT